MSELSALGALFASSFLAATVLPGGSEVVFAALLRDGVLSVWPALGVATLGNTLGGLTSYLLGRILPQKQPGARAVAWMRQWGAPALLLSWLPLVGDAFCVAAGWLRINAAGAALFIAVGKFARYAALAWLIA